MKKLIIFVAFIGCQKEALIEPKTTKQNKIETRDYIDQNFFENGPEIITQYCKDGSYCFKAVNPIPAGNFETTYKYEWGYIRCNKCGSDSAEEKEIKVKVLKGSYVVLKVQGFRVGTNIKSDFMHVAYKIN